MRDRLLGLHPKDFDVATNATPEEVRGIVRQLPADRTALPARPRAISVARSSKWRPSALPRITSDDDVVSDDEGRIIRDNVYGTIEEDVWRRDFTCNALYYNIADFSIWDFVGGVDDVARRRLVLIGDADQRLREDPVRMLRAARFAGKLDFTIDDSVASAMRGYESLLSNVPAARLFDEFLKLFQSGHAERTFDLLRRYKLFGELFPATEQELQDEPGFEPFVRAALRNTDRRVAAGKSVTPMFLVGVFLWAPVSRLAAEMQEREKMSESQALSAAAYEISGRQQRRIAIPKRFTVPMREMLALQPRFHQTRGKRAMNLLDHRRFRAAYDFMVLLTEVGQFDEQLMSFWTDVQCQSIDDRAESFQVRGKPGGRQRRSKRRRRRRKSPAAQ